MAAAANGGSTDGGLARGAAWLSDNSSREGGGLPQRSPRVVTPHVGTMTFGVSKDSCPLLGGPQERDIRRSRCRDNEVPRPRDVCRDRLGELDPLLFVPRYP